MSQKTPSADQTVQDKLLETAVSEWQRIVNHRDWNKLPDLLAENVTYSNPGDAMPLQGKDALVGSLRLSFSAFNNFEFARHFEGEEGHVLEFRGSVGAFAFTGIDIIRFDAAGMIADLVVMIRPIAAVKKLGEEAARLMAATNPAPQD